MRKQYLRILFAAMGLAGLGMATKGQPVDQILVKIPYEFVVNGKTLPAGTYKVNRGSEANDRMLVISSFENHATAAVFPTGVESSPTGKTSVSFAEVGGQHFLRKIDTADHSFTIAVSPAEIIEAAARPHSGSSATGASSGNN